MNTPFEQIGQETLYEMIDIFYRYVAHDTRINHLFPGDFEETSRKQKQFLTQFLGGPTLYSDELVIRCYVADICRLLSVHKKRTHGLRTCTGQHMRWIWIRMSERIYYKG